MIVAAFAAIVVGFLLVLPRNGVTGPASRQNTRMGSMQFRTADYQNDTDDTRFGLVRIIGLILLIAGFVLMWVLV